MEPKDLKNSKAELSGAPVEPETVNDQNVTEESAEQTEVAKVAEVEEIVEETTPEDVTETIESTIQETEELVSPEIIEEVADAAPEVVEKEVIPESVSEEVEQIASEVDEPVSPELIEDKIESAEKGSTSDEDEIIEEVADAAPEVVEKEVVPESIPDVVEQVVSEVGEPVSPEVMEDKIKSAEEESTSKGDDSTKKNESVEPKLKVIDFASLSEIELIAALKDIVESADFESMKDDVDAIKIHFFRHFRAKIEAQKAAFLEAGGDIAEFKAEPDPYEPDLRNLLKQYHDLRSEHNKKADEEKEINLQKKYDIIEEIKSLINNKESINKTFHDFRELQNQWREIGLVPQAKLKDLWDTYHHHVENFYDFIKINKELRDMDLKKNLETKIEICEKTEELLVEPSIIKAFNILQKYHEQWREVGPVPRDKKDELWERFKAATSIINKKHQDYFEGRKSEQKKNLDAKIALCEKVEEIAAAEIDTHRDWDEKSKELIELQKYWRTIGFAPKKDNNKIYERFRIASDKFFDRKREFYNQNKEEQQNNLQLKTDLCFQAEALKDSTDWKKTADEFINIQKTWKQIGPVPRKFSDVIWKRFRAACDFFFENKAKHFSSIDGEQVENLNLKKELLEEVRKFTLSGDDDADLDKLKDFQRSFTDIGHVPFRDKDAIMNEFRDLINHHFDSLRIDEKRRNLMKFKNKVESNTTSSRGQNKMRFEREKYMTKLKQMESDLALLDNNIGFFANTKNAEALIEDVNQKITVTKEKIEFLKEKIRIMDATEDED